MKHFLDHAHAIQSALCKGHIDVALALAHIKTLPEPAREPVRRFLAHEGLLPPVETREPA